MLVKKRATVKQRLRAIKLLAIRLEQGQGNGHGIVSNYRECLGSIVLIDKLSSERR